jgi:hypothetical protein
MIKKKFTVLLKTDLAMMRSLICFACSLISVYCLSQNVGIGTSVPQAKLQVNGSSAITRPLLLLTDSSGGAANVMEFARQGVSNNWIIAALPSNTASAAYLSVGIGGATPLTMIGDGRVGINTVSPGVALDVHSTQSNVAVFNSTENNMWVTLSEAGIPRAYIGSYSGAAQDVDFGAHGSNSTGKVHLTTGSQPRLSVIPNGNVGVGTVTPAEKLDVNGSVNISQSIKANGVAGQPGQLLSLNSSGNLSWVNTTEFKNHITIMYVNVYNWTVPAGVTRVMIEAWGGGGGGSATGGGGGGGYICVWKNVTAGAIVQLNIGDGGLGGNGMTNAQSGQKTSITFADASIYEAQGGAGSTCSFIPPAITGFIGKGGRYSGPVAGTYIGASGQDGQYNRVVYLTAGSIVYDEIQGGRGGNAGNSMYTGAEGGYWLRNASSSDLQRHIAPDVARIPGGGGGGFYTGSTGYSEGGSGLVIIHY